MSTLTAQTYLTPEEYLTWERKQPFKNEYHNGQIIAMSGASRAHNLVTMNVANQLYTQLVTQGCEVYPGDMRVQIHQPTSYFYPDIAVVCGEPRFGDDTFDTLLNPVLIVEGLSPSTAAFDRGEKFEHYKQLASLQEYILISQNRVHVERYLRRDTQWILTEFRKIDEVIHLLSNRCQFSVRGIYTLVKFPDA